MVIDPLMHYFELVQMAISDSVVDYGLEDGFSESVSDSLPTHVSFVSQLKRFEPHARLKAALALRTPSRILMNS